MTEKKILPMATLSSLPQPNLVYEAVRLTDDVKQRI